MKEKENYSKEREFEYIDAIQKRNDKEAMLLLIEMHKRFISQMALRFNAGGDDYEDLLSEGMLGCMEAARRFDLSTGNRFLTYATHYIRKNMTAYLDSKSTMKMCATTRMKIISGADETRKMEILPPLSCGTLKEMMIDRITESYFTQNEMDDKTFQNETSEKIRNAVLSLKNEKQRAAVLMKFGIGGKTLKVPQIAKNLGISESMVRYHIRNALKMLSCNHEIREIHELL